MIRPAETILVRINKIFLASILSICISSHIRPTDVTLTVFVHGIMSIQPHLTVSNIMRFMKDKIHKSIYATTVELMRMEPYFHYNQAMQGFGLLPLNPEVLNKTSAPNAIARIYQEMTRLATGSSANNFYYTFGWSGLMSASRRYQDAKELFIALESECAKLKKRGLNPKIRLIGYSHGGNVCLNLAAVHQDFFPNSLLKIDELILIGVPIQVETDYFVNDPIFKKIYHFYSPHDRIQQIDLFSFNRFFSRKRFVNRKKFKMPKNLMQIELKFVRTLKAKNETQKKKFINLTRDFSKPENLSGSSPLLRNISPGHIELWFFGWSPQHYRSDFIFAPLPALVAIPHIMHAIHQVEDSLTNPYTVVVDVRPDHEMLLIKQYKPEKVAFALPFATKQQLVHMNELAQLARPDNYSTAEYNQKIKHAHEKAMCIFDAEMSSGRRYNHAAERRKRKRIKAFCRVK